jgi:hypothetical protein
MIAVVSFVAELEEQDAITGVAITMRAATIRCLFFIPPRVSDKGENNIT